MGLPPSTAPKFRGLINRRMPNFRSAQEADPPLAPAARLLQRQGRGEDRLLVHINPREARLLHALGGAGTRNPRTGLLQFDDTSMEEVSDSGLPDQPGFSAPMLLPPQGGKADLTRIVPGPLSTGPAPLPPAAQVIATLASSGDPATWIAPEVERSTGILARPNAQAGEVQRVAEQRRSTPAHLPKRPETAEEILAKKKAFVAAYLAHATEIAEELGVTPGKVLALSALESGWGDLENGFAKHGNFFGLHSPSPFQSGTEKAAKDGLMAKFPSFRESARSFAQAKGHLVRGITDPAEFARVLQEKGKFGIRPDRTPDPNYQPRLIATIRGLERLLKQPATP